MSGGRRVFVGDVQGCADELDELIERVDAAFGRACQIWLVGDLVNRGPFSLRVLRRVRELERAGRAVCVLGNHDLHLLRVAAGLARPGPFDSIEEVLAAPDADDWIEWLRRRPLAATGELGAQPFAMVHAAAHPDWGLAELERRARAVEARLGAADREVALRLLSADAARDPDAATLARLTSCRSVGPAGTWSSETPELAGAGYRAWHAAWAERHHAYGVVYGHWALQGLHVADGLRGLDTGCVHHGRGHVGELTAWVPDPARERPFAVPDSDFWQVRARRSYYARRDAASA
jgi:bis(5'-nucleosyl)-tetraphosphatase (symmetrical)